MPNDESTNQFSPEESETIKAIRADVAARKAGPVGAPESEGEGPTLHAQAKENAFTKAFGTEPSFAGELYILITKYSSQCQDIATAKAMLGELVAHTLQGGVALGFHPVDILETIRGAGVEMAKDVRMVCVACEGEGKVNGSFGEKVYDCATCKGEGSIALKCE